MAETVLEHPCFHTRCRLRAWLDHAARAWTLQHGENREHQRTFTMEELIKSPPVPVRVPCGYGVHEWDEREMHRVQYDWLVAIHHYERPAPEGVPREEV